jgi:hypothetical protein
MTWEVQIVGDEKNKIKLEGLGQVLNDHLFRILERESEYFLQSSQFDTLNQSEVATLAGEILLMFSGILKLSSGSQTILQTGSIARIRGDGGKDNFISLSGTIRPSGTLSLVSQKGDGTIKITEPYDHVPDWVRLGLRDEKIAKAFRLSGIDNHNWVSLYRLYEVIQGDVGIIDMIVGKGWAAKKSINRFKQTANSPKTIGDLARHGKESTDPPKRPMKLSEAEALIEQILLKWLDAKQNTLLI